jgi:hypothetical protein
LRRTENIESAFEIKHRTKYLFFGFIIAISVAILFIHLMLFTSGDERYIGTTSAVLLGLSTGISLFIILSNPKNKEVQKFKLVFLGVALWFLGEFSYTYYQTVLGMEHPYPGVGEIFYVAGYVPLILFTYRSFKNVNRNGIVKRGVIAFVVTLASIMPVISTIDIFSQEVNFQTQWPDIVISTITNYGDIVLLSLSILILTKLPRSNPYIYHWILFTSFLILATITDLIYLTAAIVDEKFLLETELIWEAMWAFAYLFILASLVWYFKLIHILSENSAQYYSRLLKTSEYAAEYETNISVKDKDGLLEEDQLHTEKIQDFKLVENRIDEIIKSAKGEIAILFCNLSTLKIDETQSILRFLKEKTRSGIPIRILFPLGVGNSIINSYSEIANVRIFEKKIENNSIIIVSDYTKVLVASTTDPIDPDKETAYFVSYADNENIAYAYITTFEKLWVLQTVTKLDVR